MRVLLLAVGLVLLWALANDVVRTVFDVGRGGGPITGRLSARLWRAVLWARRRGAPHRWAETFGIIVVLSVVGTWLVTAWLAWTLVLASDPRAAIVEASGRPATFWERAYLAGGLIFTQSLGDIRADSTGWRLMEAAITASGLLLVTLSITYLIPVIDAASKRRHLGAYISALGRTPEELVSRAWDGQHASRLDDHLLDLISLITELGQLHLAYPALHFFHSGDRRTAISPNIAALDEALTILAYGLPESARGDPDVLDSARGAVGELIITLRLYAGAPPPAPPAPDLGVVVARGIPTVPEDDFEQAVEQLAERRGHLFGAVNEEAWDWRDVDRDPTAS